MALPQALQTELDRANEIEKQLSGAIEPTAPETPTPPPEAPPEVPPVETPAVDWEQKYRSLKGHFDAEVPKLHADNRALRGEIKALQERLDALAEKPVPEEAPAVVSEHDKEAFGADLIDLQERIAKAVAAPYERKIADLEQRLARQEAVATTTAAQQAVTAEDTYFNKLAAAVPEWEKINTDPRWLDWLGGRFPGSTATRQQQLDAARASLDIGATIEMFSAFAEMIAPPPQQHQSLQSQVAPGKSGSTSAPVTPAAHTRIWTQAEIAAALDPRELRRKTPTEVAQLMSEIDAASAEGRIR